NGYIHKNPGQPERSHREQAPSHKKQIHPQKRHQKAATQDAPQWCITPSHRSPTQTPTTPYIIYVSIICISSGGIYPAWCKTLPTKNVIVRQFDEPSRTALSSTLDSQSGEKTGQSSERKKVETFRNGDRSG
ncbi:hypothetical protein ACLEJQ_24935, partial [Pseudomonas sp. SMV71]|uniref:hypothetical protein n=1 Tax=Pseudomonas sp. SMV71 TaxID=3390195 RepID=UPI003F878C02